MTKIAYLKHPVSAEQKAEVRDAGFRIIDKRFMPEEIGENDFAQEEAIEEGCGDFTREDIDQMDKDAVRDLLKLHEVEHDGRASEDQLRDLLKKTMFVDL